METVLAASRIGSLNKVLIKKLVRVDNADLAYGDNNHIYFATDSKNVLLLAGSNDVDHCCRK